MSEREARLSQNSARMPGVGLSVRIVFLYFFFFPEWSPTRPLASFRSSSFPTRYSHRRALRKADIKKLCQGDFKKLLSGPHSYPWKHRYIA
eukprot:4120674-Prymnesium_polylepis.1